MLWDNLKETKLEYAKKPCLLFLFVFLFHIESMYYGAKYIFETVHSDFKQNKKEEYLNQDNNKLIKVILAYKNKDGNYTTFTETGSLLVINVSNNKIVQGGLSSFYPNGLLKEKWVIYNDEIVKITLYTQEGIELDGGQKYIKEINNLYKK